MVKVNPFDSIKKEKVNPFNSISSVKPENNFGPRIAAAPAQNDQGMSIAPWMVSPKKDTSDPFNLPVAKAALSKPMAITTGKKSTTENTGVLSRVKSFFNSAPKDTLGSQYYKKSVDKQLTNGWENMSPKQQETAKEVMAKRSTLPQPLFENVKEEFKRGNTSAKLSTEAFNVAMGGDENETWDLIKRKKEFEKSVQDNPLKYSDKLNETVGQVSGMLPAMGTGQIQGEITGLVFAGGALLAGNLGPQIGLPEEFITVPAAHKVGKTVGGSQYWYRQGFGDMYLTMVDNGINIDIAKGVSAVAAIPYAAIEIAQVDRIMPGFNKLAKNKFSDIAKQGVASMVKRYGVNWAQEVGEEGVQEFISVMAGEMGAWLDSEVEGKPVLQAVVGATKEALRAMSDSALPMLLMMGPNAAMESGGGYTKTGDVMRQTADEYKKMTPEQRQAGFTVNPLAGKEDIKQTQKISLTTDMDKAIAKYPNDLKKATEEFIKVQGAPVYHGTQAKFDKFESKFATDAEGRKLNLGWGKNNFYFTTKKGEALKYATRERSPEVAKLYPKGEPNVVEAFVDIKKPFDIEIGKNAERWRKVRDGYWSDGVSDFNYHKIPKGKTKAEVFVEQLKKEGYDGIVDGQEITVFNEANIKTKSQLTDLIKERFEGKKKVTKPEVAEKADSAEEKSLFANEQQNTAFPLGIDEEDKQYVLENLEPDISETIEQPERVPELSKKTPASKKVGLIEEVSTPQRVFRKWGVQKDWRAVIKSIEASSQEKKKNNEKIRAWAEMVPKESNERIFRFLDGEGIQLDQTEAQVAGEIKAWLAEFADRLGMSKDARISEYITHIFPMDERGEIPEEIASLIRNKQAKSVYNPFQLHRTGAEGYLKDTWKALEAYQKRATRKVHLDPALKQFSKATAHLTEASQAEYIEERISAINMRPTKWETKIDNSLKAAFPNMGPRATLRATAEARKMLSRAKIAGSATSFAKNLTQGINTWAELGNKYTLKGYADLGRFGQKELDENNVLRDNFYDNTEYSAIKKFVEKTDKAMFFNMTYSEMINKGAAYYGAKAKFLDGKITGKEYDLAFGEKMPDNYKPTLEDAIDYGKHVAEKTQFYFGPAETQGFLRSPLMKTAFQWQTFSLKQAEYVARMATDKEYAKLVRYMIGSSLLFKYVGGLFGMKWFDSGNFFRWGLPPVVQFIKDIWTEGIIGKDKYGNELDFGQRASAVGESLFTNVMPMGAQIKKSYEGIKTVKEGGSRNAAKKLQYKVKQTPLNYVRGALFGKYNLPEAKQYYKDQKDKAKGKKKKTTTKSSKTNPF